MNLEPKLDPVVKMSRGKPIAVGPTAKLTWRRTHVSPASEFHAETAKVLENIERRFGDAIIEGEN